MACSSTGDLSRASNSSVDLLSDSQRSVGDSSIEVIRNLQQFAEFPGPVPDNVPASLCFALTFFLSQSLQSPFINAPSVAVPCCPSYCHPMCPTRKTTLERMYIYDLGAHVEYPETSASDVVGHLFQMDLSHWASPRDNFCYSQGAPMNQD